MSQMKIDVQHLDFSYDGKREVLSDISFQAAEGESIGIIGANGAGKSTLLKILVGLELTFSGDVRIDGLLLTKEHLSEIRGKTGYVFQDSDSQLFMTTVGEDVAFAPRNYGFSEEETEKRVREALEKVHITHLRETSIYRLSGGEKKLASLATILSMTPEMILLDEPTVALDPGNRRNLIRVTNELEALKIITSHDLDYIWDTCGRTILMWEGRIVYDGPTEEIMRNREMLEQYGLELPLSLSRQA